MIKNLLILVTLGALVGSSAFGGCIQSALGKLTLEITDDLGHLTITKATSNYEEKGFIYGRIFKLTHFWDAIAFEVVKIHVITFNPFNFNTYLTDTTVSILNGYKGFLSKNSIFLWGEFSIIPPESDIINLVVSERDPINSTLQWIVIDAPFIQRGSISWALLDVNNTNVTGTNATVHNWDDLCNTVGDTYDVQAIKHGMYTFCLTYEATGLLLFKSEPEWY